MYQHRGKRGAKLERTQISLSKEDRALVQKIADGKGVSMSHIIREAIRQYAEDLPSEDPWERLMDLAGFVESGDPRSSVDHDQVIYG
ncbi:MAG: ribbon-helix-helix protein, CopG family [Dehalococcoidia bacterium]|nr:ribbon-helix-helix protein, CopG family [Dehalococcoidia bacterium]